jgi:phospholipase C
VSWVYAGHADSEHPPDTSADRAAGVGNVAAGMAWTAAQIDAIVGGGLWDKTAVFVTWDDWGGWADHVDPPKVETWADGTQFRYGNRVPCLVVSAYAKGGYISHTQHSHVSLIRFCEQNFGLPSLNARTTAADDMSDCFDYSRALPPPQQTPPAQTPPAQTPPAQTPPAQTPPQRTPPGQPPPTLTPHEALTAIRDSATRAGKRIDTASQATSETSVREQLRYAAEDIARIKALSNNVQ